MFASPPQPLDLSQRRSSALVAAAFAAMIAYLVVSHLHPGAAILGCPFHALTGHSCPGCGMTRSTANFLFGNLEAAVRYHPFGPLFVIAFAISATHHALRAVSGRELDYAALRFWKRISKPVFATALVLLALFGAVRLGLELTGFLTPL